MGKIRTIKRGGSRFYVDPVTEEKVPGVTSVVGMTPKPFLTFWAAKMTAEAAVDNLGAITRIADGDRDGAVDYLKGAHRRYTSARAKVGSAAHDMFERMVRGEDVRRVGPDLEPYRMHFAEFLHKCQPELVSAEDTVWSDAHGYAGSYDAILRMLDADGEPTTVIVDWKTSKAAYPEVALQLSAYAHADRVVNAAGESSPLPAVDAGAVLHITADRWELIPARIDAGVFEFFTHLRAVFRWDREVSGTVLGRPVASGGRLVSGTERRA